MYNLIIILSNLLITTRCPKFNKNFINNKRIQEKVIYINVGNFVNKFKNKLM